MDYIVKYRPNGSKIRMTPIVAECYEDALEIGQSIAAGHEFFGVAREGGSDGGSVLSDRHANGTGLGMGRLR